MKPDDGFVRCDYKSFSSECRNGYLKGTSDYDRGMKSLAHSPKMAARQPCPKCHGQGQIREGERDA